MTECCICKKCLGVADMGETGFDVAKIRQDFPILNRRIHKDKPLAYLDNAATTQKPSVVVCALCDYYQICNANVHRSLHLLADEATQHFEEARRKVVQFIHARNEKEIIYTRGTTESINLVAYSWGRKHIKAGDEIILTEMEHHSNLVPWQILAKEKNAVLRFIPVLEDGTLDMKMYHQLLNPKVKLVGVVHISNVLGTINPIHEIIADAHRIGALVLVDGAQSVPHMPIDVQEIDCDFLAFSGHKMMAPTGVGVLYGKESVLETMDPFMGGGEMINKVTLEGSTWADLPLKFEAGTPHISGAIGLGAAINYLMNVGMKQVEKYEHELTRYTLEKLSPIPGLKIYGHAPERSGAISFVLNDVHPHDLAQFVDQAGVAIRAGHMCAQPLMRKLGVPAVSRASLYVYNLPCEIDQLVDAIYKAKEYFSHGS
jgi:cysteine desulfurase/selenocysteine lyase